MVRYTRLFYHIINKITNILRLITEFFCFCAAAAKQGHKDCPSSGLDAEEKKCRRILKFEQLCRPKNTQLDDVLQNIKFISCSADKSEASSAGKASICVQPSERI